MKLTPSLAVLSLIFGLFACDSDDQAPAGGSQGGGGGGESAETVEDPLGTGAAAEAVRWEPSLGTAPFSGRVTFEGEAPAILMIPMASDPACHEGGEKEVPDESLLVGPDGGLQNVFVYISKGTDAWTFEAPAESARLAQKGCTYSPHVLGVQVGQKLLIENGDSTVHNVHMHVKRNRSFNQTQMAGSKDLEVVFRKEEVMIPVNCDMHSWMGCHIGVVEHPFFSVSAADGSFDLGKLAPGDYTITARHEKLGKQSQEITVVDGEAMTLEFSFAPQG